MKINIQRIISIFVIMAFFITLPLGISLIYFIFSQDIKPFMNAFILGYWFYVFVGISGWLIIGIDMIQKIKIKEVRQNNDENEL